MEQSSQCFFVALGKPAKSFNFSYFFSTCKNLCRTNMLTSLVRKEKCCQNYPSTANLWNKVSSSIFQKKLFKLKHFLSYKISKIKLIVRMLLLCNRKHILIVNIFNVNNIHIKLDSNSFLYNICHLATILYAFLKIIYIN